MGCGHSPSATSASWSTISTALSESASAIHTSHHAISTERQAGSVERDGDRSHGQSSRTALGRVGADELPHRQSFSGLADRRVRRSQPNEINRWLEPERTPMGKTRMECLARMNRTVHLYRSHRTSGIDSRPLRFGGCAQGVSGHRTNGGHHACEEPFSGSCLDRIRARANVDSRRVSVERRVARFLLNGPRHAVSKPQPRWRRWWL
jgi:hypothetical protein